MDRWTILGPLALVITLLIGGYLVPRLIEISQLDWKAPAAVTSKKTGFHYVSNGRLVSTERLPYHRVQDADKMAHKGIEEMTDGNQLQAALLLWKVAEKLPDAQITEPRRTAYLKQAKRALVNFFSF